MSDMLDSVILGKIADPVDGTEDQCDVNELSLLEYNKQKLLDGLYDKDISRWDIKFYLDSILEYEFDGQYWAFVMKEVIKSFSLNTLKVLLSDDIDRSRAESVIQIIRFLKVEMPILKYESKLPNERNLLLEYLDKNQAPEMLKFAIKTISEDDLHNFVKYFK